MDKIHQNHLEYVSHWQNETIEILETNNIEFFDMAWIFEDIVYKDCMNSYASRSDYFKSLFNNNMMKGTSEIDGVTAYKVGDLMKKRHIFDMIRIFCHTGIVQSYKGEPILKTLERYSAFHYYALESGMSVIRRIIMDVINPTNALQALDYVLSSPECESGLLPDVENYISTYAFVIFKHKSFSNIKLDKFYGISELCRRDDLNIKEIDLLRCLHRLCDKKIPQDNLESAWSVMTHDLDEFGSLWNQIRISSLSIDDFMGFVKENDTLFSNDSIVSVIKFLYENKSEDNVVEKVDYVMGNHESKRRKTFQPISFYPRNLHFHGLASPQTDISYWDDSRIKMFFAVDYSKKDSVTLPPIPFHGYVIHFSLFHHEKVLNIGGSIHGMAMESSPIGSMKITASVVNFKHDRWKKTCVTTDIKKGTEFKMNSILSCSTIDHSDTSGGYLFDIEKYPDYSPNGSWLLMYISVEK